LKSHRTSGFTLVEFILVMVVLSVLSMLALPVIKAGFNGYFVQKSLREANWQGRLALERMTREIASFPSSQSITLATSSALSFTDNTNTSVRYELVGTRLERNDLSLAEGVQSIHFFYGDSNGESTTVIENIRYVGILFTVIENNMRFTFDRVVALRNNVS
jgi:prepilin-type N-terminal cleavage/methylation domain-containing protein